MKLTIITPSCRPGNLKKVKESINIDCTWIIVYDSEIPIKQFKEPWIKEMNVKGGVSGNLQRNLALDNADRNSWVYFLDDDNLLHPDFKEIYIEGNLHGLIFAQDLGTGIRKPDKNNIKVCHVDQAQYLLHYSLIKDRRFIQSYEADGHFIEDIYKKYSCKIMIVEDVLCYYNKLRQ